MLFQSFSPLKDILINNVINRSSSNSSRKISLIENFEIFKLKVQNQKKKKTN